MVGASFAKRTLSFRSARGLDEQYRPAGYEGGIVPGAYVSGALYPFAFGAGSGAASRLGITFLYDKAFGINSSVIDPNTMEAITVPTVQRRWGVGAAYRMAFGKSPTNPSITLLVGYHKSRFVIDKQASPVEIDVPNTKYTWIDPGVRFRVGLSRPIALYAEARALAVLFTGEVQKPMQYGAATVTGLDADAGIEYWITSRYLLRVGARYTALGYDFKGNGVLSDRDGDGETDVGGALDAYLGGYATLGVGL
jgi:hypothetical protein